MRRRHTEARTLMIAGTCLHCEQPAGSLTDPDAPLAIWLDAAPLDAIEQRRYTLTHLGQCAQREYERRQAERQKVARCSFRELVGAVVQEVEAKLHLTTLTL